MNWTAEGVNCGVRLFMENDQHRETMVLAPTMPEQIRWSLNGIACDSTPSLSRVCPSPQFSLKRLKILNWSSPIEKPHLPNERSHAPESNCHIHWLWTPQYARLLCAWLLLLPELLLLDCCCCFDSPPLALPARTLFDGLAPHTDPLCPFGTLFFVSLQRLSFFFFFFLGEGGVGRCWKETIMWSGGASERLLQIASQSARPGAVPRHRSDGALSGWVAFQHNRLWFAWAAQRTDQSDIHSKLYATEARKILGEDLVPDRHHLPNAFVMGAIILDWLGGSVRRLWFTRGLTLYSKSCQSHWKSAHRGDCVPQSALFIHHPDDGWCPENSDALRLPNIGPSTLATGTCSTLVSFPGAAWRTWLARCSRRPRKRTTVLLRAAVRNVCSWYTRQQQDFGILETSDDVIRRWLIGTSKRYSHHNTKTQNVHPSNTS